MNWLLLYVVVEWAIIVAMVLVVLRRQLPTGTALAWLGVVFLHPYVGLGLYLLVGQNRLGVDKSALRAELVAKFRGGAAQPGRAAHAVAPSDEGVYDVMVRQAERISGLPALAGNRVELLPTCDGFVDRLVADIDAATHSVHLLYYIWSRDHVGRRVAEAVERAAGRGVACRVMADALGSRPLLRRSPLPRQLRAAGAAVVRAMPAAPLRRGDLRNHRKLAVIDGQIGYVGSHNLIDPGYGGRRGGPWVDLTARYTGPVVGELAATFAEDWQFETRQPLDVSAVPAPVTGDDAVAAQVVPTGPGSPADSYRRVLLAALQCARERATLTTPYFVPDDATLVALQMAADRGVDVRLILPANPDHLFTAAAGRAHYRPLLANGVRLFLYRPGLLHAKTVTVDDAFAIVGSANLDVRSFQLNFELSVVLYGQPITDRVRSVQASYLSDSEELDLLTWSRRSPVREYADRAISLLSPLL